MSVTGIFASGAPNRFGEAFFGDISNYASRLDEPIALPNPRGVFRPRKSRLKRTRAALELRRLENVLAVGIWLYERFHCVERNSRKEVLDGKTIFDPSEEASIMAFFSQWLAPCDRCMAEIERFASAGTTIDGGDRFRGYCEEARKVLWDAVRFFDDANDAARWDRVTAFIRPDPRAVRVEMKERSHFRDDGRAIPYAWA